MDIKTINRLQHENGLSDLQEMITSGIAWKMEGSVGREAMSALKSGACMLPLRPMYDAYGNCIPSRDDLVEGTKGTLTNSINFWKKVENGEAIVF